MEDQFLDNAYQLFERGKTVLLACSGGADSVALFHLLTKSDIVFSVAHVNYQLRGKESDGDEDFVRVLCKDYNIEFFSKKVSLAKTEKSIQKEAREVRFQFFKEILDQHQIDFLATAHHQDDLAENTLFRLMRGTGLKGLTSFGGRTDKIKRPLMPFKKEEILEYLSENQLSFRQDKSNFESNYSRNKIRNQVLPLMEKDLPNISKRIAHSTALLSDDYNLLNAFFAPFKEDLNKGVFRMSCDHILAKEPSFWFQLVEGLNAAQAKQLAKACEDKDGIFQIKLANWFIFIVKDIVSVSIAAPAEDSKQSFEIAEKKNFEDALSSSVSLSIIFEEGNTWGSNNNALCLNADILNFPLTVRHPKEGDKFQPLGMKGTKLLSDFYNDLKIPSGLKKEEWVLVDALGEIIALIPHRISEEYKLSNISKSKLSISLVVKN